MTKAAKAYHKNMTQVMNASSGNAKTNIARHHDNLIKSQKEKDSQKIAELEADYVKAQGTDDLNLVQEAQDSIANFKESAKKNIESMLALKEVDLK